MKTALLVTFILYLVSFFYTGYSLAIRLFVHFANKNLGYQDDFFGEVENSIFLVLTFIFGLFAGFGFYAYRTPSLHPLIKLLVFLPVGIVVLYVLFAIVLLISSGGRWN